MIRLNPTQQAEAMALADRAYKYMAPEVRTELNRQMKEALTYDRWYDYLEWLERMELNARWYESPEEQFRLAKMRKRTPRVKDAG
jgi:hypothetical protein